MKEFSFTRYLRILRWFLQANRTQLFFWTAGSALSIFVGELFFSWLPLRFSTTTEFYASNIMALSGFFAAVLLIVALVAFSSIFSIIQKRQRASLFLMLPATNGEKYAVLLTYVTLVWPLSVLLAFIVGDTLRMLVMPLFYRVDFVSGVPAIFDMLTPHAFSGVNGTSLAAAAFMLVLLVWSHSIYVAAGSVFRKHAFVIVTTALFVCVGTFGYICSLLFGRFRLMSNYDGDLYVHPVLWVVTIVLAIWAVYNYRLSYRLFKNLQVINDKRTNL